MFAYTFPVVRVAVYALLFRWNSLLLFSLHGATVWRVKLWLVFDAKIWHVKKVDERAQRTRRIEVNVLICRILQLNNCACWNVQFTNRWFMAVLSTCIHKRETTTPYSLSKTNGRFSPMTIIFWHLTNWQIERQRRIHSTNLRIMKSKLTIEFAADDTLEWSHPVCVEEESQIEKKNSFSKFEIFRTK